MSPPDNPELPPVLMAHIQRLQRQGPYLCACCKAPAGYLGVVPTLTGKFAVFSVCAACKERDALVDVEEMVTVLEARQRN